MNLLAKSCFSPGFIALMSNLITSCAVEDGAESVGAEWVGQYAAGMEHEMYKVSLSEKMEGKTFQEIAKAIYKKTKAIVFALEVRSNGRTVTRLNPAEFVVNNIAKNQVKVYVITPDDTHVERVETIGMNKEQIKEYLNTKAQKEKDLKLEKQYDSDADSDDDPETDY